MTARTTTNRTNMTRFKIPSWLVVGLTLSVAITTLAARLSSQGPFARLMVPPELVIRFADELELSEGKREECRQLVESTTREHAQGEQHLRGLRKRLRTLLEADEIDQGAVENTAKKFLETESTMKLARIRLHTRVLALLTPLQRRLARAIRDQIRNAKTEVPAKIERVRTIAERRQRDGKSVQPIKRRMDEVERAMRGGDVLEAIQLLDALLAELETDREK